MKTSTIDLGSPAPVPANFWDEAPAPKRELVLTPLREKQIEASLTVESFLQGLRGKDGNKAAPRTVAFYRFPLEKFARYCPKPILEVTEEDVYAFQGIVRERHSRQTVRNYTRAVKMFLQHGGSKIQIKNPKFAQPVAEEYTPEQLKILFAAADPRELRLFSFYLGTGCLEGETRHAVWENLTASQYKVAPTGDWKPEKPRIILISEELSNLLEPVRSTGLIFPNIHMKPDGHHLKKLQALAARSGQNPKEFQLVKFRHTYAVRLLRKGEKTRDVANSLGVTTARVNTKYRDLAEGTVRRGL